MKIDKGNATTTYLVICFAAVIAVLAGFLAVAAGGSLSGASDEELGAAFGRGLFFTLLVWAAMHFGYLRARSSKQRWSAGALVVLMGIVGCIFGLSV